MVVLSSDSEQHISQPLTPHSHIEVGRIDWKNFWKYESIIKHHKVKYLQIIFSLKRNRFNKNILYYCSYTITLSIEQIDHRLVCQRDW